VRRALEFLVRNWPLKLAAIGLATVLYAGVVLSGNSRSWPGEVPIAVVDPPAGGVLLSQPGSVTGIRYRAPLDIAGSLGSQSFRASIDLAGLSPQAGGPAMEVPVQLVALDPRVTVVDYAPRALEVRLDSVVGRTMPITVERGVAPEGLVLGPPQTDPSTVLLRGASSRLADVRSVVARIVVDGSGLNIDQVVDLEAVDESGDLVPGVEVVPADSRVRIDVARELAYAVLPVVVDLEGEPAPGYRVGSVTVDPPTVTVSGEAPAVERLAAIMTEPVPIDGLMADRSRTFVLELPPEISLIGVPEATVTVGIVPARGSRVMEVGLVLEGARRDRQTSLSTGSVLATLSGDVVALDALEAGRSGTLVGTVDVAGLGNGRHEVRVAVSPPDGLTLVDVAPGTVVVRIGPARPPASAPPSAAPASPVPSQAAITPSRTALGASMPPSGGAGDRRASPIPSPVPTGGS
jgi:YbbR domain-containing protein